MAFREKNSYNKKIGCNPCKYVSVCKLFYYGKKRYNDNQYSFLKKLGIHEHYYKECHYNHKENLKSDCVKLYSGN